MFLGVGIGAGIGLGGVSLSALVAALFAASEPGVWLDPSDLSTLFQDDAGTMPVTAAGQSVGRILDKSGRGNHATQSIFASRPIYGVEPSTGRRNLITPTQEAAWVGSPTGGWSTSYTNVTSTGTSWIVTEHAVSGQKHIHHPIVISGVATTRFKARLVGTKTRLLALEGRRADDQWVSPLVNLVTGQISNPYAGVTCTATPLGDGWFEIRKTDDYGLGNTYTNFALILLDAAGSATYAGDTTSGFEFKDFQLELGAEPTPYQRVVSQYDVTDPVGFPSYPCHYLAFDGVDDFLVTPTITPGTDKVQVFAGARKLSDAAIGSIAETRTSSTTPGHFGLLMPDPASTPTVQFISRGTATAFASVNNAAFAAPLKAVLSGLAEIQSDTARLRVNGVQVAAPSTDQGTGNYLAHAMYIGRQGGTSLPFNGRLYGLITRFGPNLTADQIAQAERWMNSKTGAY